MKVGSIGYCTEQGLGVLLLDFYKHGVITHPVLIAHGRPNHWGWYPDSVPRITDARNPGQLRKCLDYLCGCDAVLFLETPFFWDWFVTLREQGVKTFLMPMHECMPRALPYQPDYFINPSLLDQKCYPERSVFIPVPVPDEVPFRRRERARVFVHNAGHGGLKGRNGTKELVEALKFVKSKALFLFRSQEPIDKRLLPYDGDRVDVRVGSVPWDKLWEDGGEGDVFVFPEKFNGLSLPLQEAYAAGYLVMATDRFPMNTWLPNQPLIPTVGSRVSQIGPCRNFDEAVIDPKDIADVIDWWYDKDISAYSETGYEWRREHSWEVLKPRYLNVLRDGVKS
jgi:glycosyltransferase involved in cell wall biosynthesis